MADMKLTLWGGAGGEGGWGVCTALLWFATALPSSPAQASTFQLADMHLTLWVGDGGGGGSQASTFQMADVPQVQVYKACLSSTEAPATINFLEQASERDDMIQNRG